MKKKKMLLGWGAILGIVILGIVISFMIPKSDGSEANTSVENALSGNVQELIGNTKYTNLVFTDFQVHLPEITEVHSLELLRNKSYEDRTFLQNFEMMNEVIDKFFQEDFDKSFIQAEFYIDGEKVYVNYNDVETVCTEEKYNDKGADWLFGHNGKDCMVQIEESYRNTWFSRFGLGTVHPGAGEYKKVYPYLSGVRTVEDVEINLKDGSIMLSEMEGKALTFLNENFPMEVTEGVDFVIGDARIIANGEFEAVCFLVRRMYKGIPFEYGANASSNSYIDVMDHDNGELTYVESTRPDTMLAFDRVNTTLVETNTITEMITLKGALDLLSAKIGDNSVYDVLGIELVYRECEVPEERQDEVDGILKPVWKIITVNQNDHKYTLFYVDIVTGSISERFEYYYE